VLMLREPVLYPRAYGVYVALAALDVIITWVILMKGGRELNQLAAWVFDHHGLTGAVLYKFGLVSVVLASCEYVGRESASDIGRSLAFWAVVISMAPVVVGAVELGGWYLAFGP